MSNLPPRGFRSAAKKRRPLDLTRLLGLLLGLVILVLALPPFFRFPWLEFWLVPVAALYFCLLFLMPRAWLIVLPVATVSVDFAPWTGRFAYNELDLLFLTTISSGLIFGRFRYRVFAPSFAVAILASYFVVSALGYSGWGQFLIPHEQGQSNTYYGAEYSYKLFKGMVWGILLVPMWGHLLASNKLRSVYTITAGVSAAAIVMSMVVLWERGTMGLFLSGSDWYSVVGSLVDLSSSYRVTGIISDMHTGGEAIDGLLLLMLPFTLHGCIYGRVAWLRILAAMGFLSVSYVVLVGFTRTTYVAFAFGLLSMCFLTLSYRQKANLRLPFPLNQLLLLLAAGTITSIAAVRLAGGLGLLSYVSLLALAIAENKWSACATVKYGSMILAAILVGAACIGHYSSQWAEASFLGALVLILCLGFSYLIARKLYADCPFTLDMNQLFLSGSVAVLPTILALALGGYQFGDRLTKVADDFGTRLDHWENVVASSSSGPLAWLVGNGVGSFPALYIGAHPERVKEVGSFVIQQERQRSILKLGGGRDLTLGQRTHIQPFLNYVVSVELRSETAGFLELALCERNLIYANNFAPNCTSGRIPFSATEGLFEQFTLELNSNKVGSRDGIMRWPTLVTIKNANTDAVVDIVTVTLSPDGLNQLQNSSFRDGLDYWFFYNDFAHLPWHVKNLFLQVWFESGWLGIALFFMLLGLLTKSNFERRAYDSLNPVYTSAVLAVVIFGILGSPLDSARVSWFFYFLLCAGLVQLKGVKKRTLR